MDITVAKEILFEAVEGGYWDSNNISDEDFRLIEDAKWLYAEAKKFTGSKDIHIKTIVSLGDSVTEETPAIRKEQLWIPPELTGDTTEMPNDLTTLDDLKLRRLYSVFGAYVSRAKYLVSQEQSALSNATHMRDAAYRKAYVKYNAILDGEGQRATKDLIEANIRTKDDNFNKWEDRVREHEDKLGTIKALSDIYSSNCDRISREATMRHNEWERSR